jgi:hypothetical protein
MEPYSILIGLFFIAIFIVPVWLFQRTQTKGARNLSKSFRQAASANGLSISQFDLWQNVYGIGLDEQHKKLLYLKHEKEKDHTAVVDLAIIDKCNIEKKINNIAKNKSSNGVTERLALVLTHNDDKNIKDSLEFYDESVSPLMNGELAKLEKWQKIISGKLVKA